MTDLARIELLEARAQIAELIYQYAQGVRNGNFENCASLFTEDATFEVRLAVPGQPASAITRSKVTGRAAIQQQLHDAASTGNIMLPMISNLMINIQHEQATSNSMMSAMVWPGGQTVIGEYDDGFQLDGTWQFASRIYTIFRPRS